MSRRRRIAWGAACRRGDDAVRELIDRGIVGGDRRRLAGGGVAQVDGREGGPSRHTAHMMKPVDTLRRLVELESPTGDPARIAHIGEFIAAELAVARGARCTTTAQLRPRQLRPRGRRQGGSAAACPSWTPCGPRGRSSGCRSGWTASMAHGPGALDMKGGIVVMLEALRRGIAVAAGRCSVLVTGGRGDRQPAAGGRTSRRLAAPPPRRRSCSSRRCSDGTITTERSGLARYQLRIEGEAAHAGHRSGRASRPSRSWPTRRCALLAAARPSNAASVSTSARWLVARATTSSPPRPGRGSTRGPGRADEQTDAGGRRSTGCGRCSTARG